MKADDLIRMANQIATSFKTYPEAEAAAKIAAHITSFWDPRMRQRLNDMSAEEVAQLLPLAQAARNELV